jgi:nitrogenase molybdenum-iron protein alpha/beta subunit
MNEVIGLDLEAVVKSLGDTSPTKIVVLKVDVFSGRDRTIPQDQYAAQFLQLMDPPEKRDEGRVNLFSGRWGYRREPWEIDQVLLEAGFSRVVAFPSQGSTAEDLRTAPEAGHTIILHDVFTQLGERMRDRFGCKIWLGHRPIGLEVTRTWYERCSRALGVALPYGARYERALARAEAVRPLLAGKRFGLKSDWGAGHLARLLVELGMKPVALAFSDDPRPWQRPHLAYLLEKGFDPWICRPNLLVLEGLLREEAPDFTVGFPELERDLGIPDIPLKGTTLSFFEATEYVMDVLASHFSPHSWKRPAKEASCAPTT